MSESHDVGLMPRSTFRLPRVPFDFRALALAMLGFLVYWGGGWVVTRVVHGGNGPSVPGAFLDWFTGLLLGLDPVGGQLRSFLDAVFGLGGGGNAKPLELAVGGAWFVGCWAFFGQAVRRIVALRIARDEGLGMRQALGFAASNWASVLLAPVIVAIAVGIFWGLNALAGLALSIPVGGMLLSILLVPLAAISTLLMLMIALGGVLGFPLVGAAAAWERNGALDAISRSFSYVFARPLQYFFTTFLVLLFVGVILWGGSWFSRLLVHSVASGTVNSRVEVALDAPEPGTRAHQKLGIDAQQDAREYRLRTGLTGSAPLGLGLEREEPALDVAPPEPDAGQREREAELERLAGEVGTVAPGRGGRSQPFVRDVEAVLHGPGTHKLTLFMFWLFVNLAWVGVLGYALFWYLGATCCLYADLRYDVDGTEEDEIHTDEDDAALEVDLPPMPGTPGTAVDGAGAPATATPPAGEAPAGGTTPPASA